MYVNCDPYSVEIAQGHTFWGFDNWWFTAEGLESSRFGGKYIVKVNSDHAMTISGLLMNFIFGETATAMKLI